MKLDMRVDIGTAAQQCTKCNTNLSRRVFVRATVGGVSTRYGSSIGVNICPECYDNMNKTLHKELKKIGDDI